MFDCFYLFVCFVFKQKTAYEMRISDWSSDVCSSDLASFIGLLHHSTGRSSASCGPRGRRGSRHRLHVHGLPTPSRHYTRSRRQSHVRAPQPSPSRIASSCGRGFTPQLLHPVQELAAESAPTSDPAFLVSRRRSRAPHPVGDR